MTLDEREGPFADRSEADHYDRAVDASVPGPMRHGVGSPSRTSDAKRLRRCLKPRLPEAVNSAGHSVSVGRLWSASPTAGARAVKPEQPVERNRARAEGHDRKRHSRPVEM